MNKRAELTRETVERLVTGKLVPPTNRFNHSAIPLATELANFEELAERSPIVEFFRGRSVFVTGASGFIGKVLIEKLLRNCATIKRIFVLVRPKRGKTGAQRLESLLRSKLFDHVRAKNLLHGRLAVVEGQITEPNMGLDEAHLARLLDEVSVVYHSAATVKFDDPLKMSVLINVEGTRNIVELCRRMRRLEALIHVSTAYANCDHHQLDEHIYPVQLDPQRLARMAHWLDQQTLDQLKARLLGKKPNTYTYTKCLAEWLLLETARDLPLIIVRPSIVVATWREPFPGWVDSVNGPTGIILSGLIGLIRFVYAKRSVTADLVPVDLVANLLVSLAWFAPIYHNTKKLGPARSQEGRRSLNDGYNHTMQLISSARLSPPSSPTMFDDGYASPSPTENRRETSVSPQPAGRLPANRKCVEWVQDVEKKVRAFRRQQLARMASRDLPPHLADVPVFHCTSGRDNPISWGDVEDVIGLLLEKYPSVRAIRVPYGRFTSSRYLYSFHNIVSHYLPAYILDFILRLRGRRAQIVRAVDRYNQTLKVLSFFTEQSWNFNADNQYFLLNELMTPEDRILFDFDIRKLNWVEFMTNYTIGVRQHLLNEPLANLAETKRKISNLYWRDKIFTGLLILVISYLLLAITFTS